MFDYLIRCTSVKHALACMTGVVNPNVSLIGQHEVGIDSYGTYNDLAWYMIERAASMAHTDALKPCGV